MRRKQLLRLIIAAPLSLVTLVSAPAAFATNYSLNCTDTGFSCGLFDYAGAEGDYTYGPGTNGHNCTTYIAWIFWNTLPVNGSSAQFTKLNALGDASTWATRAAQFGYSVTKMAKPNSVAQWNYGHVAFVESVATVNGAIASIVISEDNVYTTNPSIRMSRRRTLARTSSEWPDNFIDFGIVNNGSSGGGRPPAGQVVTPGTNSN